MSAAFEVQKLSDEVKPLRVSNREAYVFPSYRKRMESGEHAEDGALVTSGGKPIVRNNETLLLGMVPLERRYAIGPVENGKAEVLPQHIFADEHEKMYVAEFALKNQPPDNPKLRYVPSVVNFVAWKIDPTDPSRIAQLGFQPNKVAVTATANPAAEEVEALIRHNDRQTIELDEMKRKLDELSALMAQKPKAPLEIEVVKPKALVTAKCGKEVKEGFVKQHERFCKNPECQPPTE